MIVHYLLLTTPYYLLLETMAHSWLGIDPSLAIIGWAILEEADYEQPSLIDYSVDAVCRSQGCVV